METILNFLHDAEFVRRFEGSATLCVVHTMRAAEANGSHSHLHALIDIQRRKYAHLVGELEEFCRKHDYRFSHESWGSESDSWLRAIELLAGKSDVFGSEIHRKGSRDGRARWWIKLIDHCRQWVLVDCQCVPPYRELSIATRDYMWEVLGEDDLAYLRSFPVKRSLELGGARFYLCHAAPSNNLYRYLPYDSPDAVWQDEAARVNADFVLIGHTHQQFVRPIGEKSFVNPGSLGQPKGVGPVACYAIWENGQIELKRISYPLPRDDGQDRPHASGAGH